MGKGPGSAEPDCGPYGALVDPALYAQPALGRIWSAAYYSPDPKYNAAAGLSTGYTLGAKLSRFNSAYQILISEAANSGGTGLLRAIVVKTLVRDTCGYTYNNGVVAFRHPFNAKANFAFFDAHVERLGVRDDWNTDARWTIP